MFASACSKRRVTLNFLSLATLPEWPRGALWHDQVHGNSGAIKPHYCVHHVVGLPPRSTGQVIDEEESSLTSSSAPEIAQIFDSIRPMLGQRGLVLWFTGLPGSGKSILADLLACRLQQHDARTITLVDGSVVRRLFSKGLGSSKEGRTENIRCLGLVAHGLAQSGAIAIVASISPYRDTRETARALVEETGGIFVEIHVATSFSVCMERDRKTWHRRVWGGEVEYLADVDCSYETPLEPDLRIDCGKYPPHAALEIVWARLCDRKLVNEICPDDSCRRERASWVARKSISVRV